MAVDPRSGGGHPADRSSGAKPAAGLAERMSAIADLLTPAERRIAQVLSATNMLAGLETVQKLAERANVSGPSILRFTTKLGFEGFADFQAAVSEDIQSRFTSPLDQYARATAQQRGGLVEHALETFHAGLERTLRRLDHSLLERVARLLSDPRRPVYCVGGRFTQHLAEMLWGHLYQLRPDAHILRAGVVGVQDQLVELGRRAVLVAFDVRRYQTDTIELAERAKARRAHIILITDTLLSPISRIAKDVLTCDLDAPSPYDSLVPCMALVETLIAAVTEHAGERGRLRIAEIESLRSPRESE
ncbi:MAG TPA: MurR/RpiR family transcriptional regulator [Steroidobacteraceae bacterium]|nr:MurR/RpiR family transcriptional regulator [Steroidobacteraceae bacterium]